jgi:hypothetical protein
MGAHVTGTEVIRAVHTLPDKHGPRLCGSWGVASRCLEGIATTCLFRSMLLSSARILSQTGRNLPSSRDRTAVSRRCHGERTCAGHDLDRVRGR